MSLVNSENIFFDILKANKSISNLDIKIKKLEAKKEYGTACWLLLCLVRGSMHSYRFHC